MGAACASSQQTTSSESLSSRSSTTGGLSTSSWSMIFLSSLAMACEVPEALPREEDFFYWLDVVFLVAFGIEALMKIVAFGFLFGRNHYLHDAWNCMDFLIVVMSFFGVALATLNVEGLGIFRIMRTLRPLRFLSESAPAQGGRECPPKVSARPRERCRRQHHILCHLRHPIHAALHGKVPLLQLRPLLRQHQWHGPLLPSPDQAALCGIRGSR